MNKLIVLTGSKGAGQKEAVEFSLKQFAGRVAQIPLPAHSRDIDVVLGASDQNMVILAPYDRALKLHKTHSQRATFIFVQPDSLVQLEMNLRQSREKERVIREVVSLANFMATQAQEIGMKIVRYKRRDLFLNQIENIFFQVLGVPAAF